MKLNKGISFFFGYISDTTERANLIKKIGFDSIIASQDSKFNHENGTIKQQIKLFNEVRLSPSSLHMTYTTEELPHFWQDDEIGEKIKRSIINDVLTASKYKFKSVVVHLVGEYTKIGEKRLYEILDFCKTKSIPLAIENLIKRKIIVDVFNNINHEMLKFCFDSGHQNAFDKDFPYLEYFGDKLVALHLHDNNGLVDEHTIPPFSGTIDWDIIAKQLAVLPQIANISLDYETLNKSRKNVTEFEFIFAVKQHSDMLEEKINKYLNK